MEIKKNLAESSKYVPGVLATAALLYLTGGKARTAAITSAVAGAAFLGMIVAPDRYLSVKLSDHVEKGKTYCFKMELGYLLMGAFAASIAANAYNLGRYFI